MVEQSHSRKRNRHVIFIGTFDYQVVANRAAGFGNIFYAAELCSLDIVAEREECIRAERNSVDSVEIFTYLRFCKRFGTGGKIFLPVTLGTNIFLAFIDISVNYVVTLGSAESGEKGKIKNPVALAKEPCVRLSAGKTGAVNSRLLTCADADSLSVIGKAD